MRIGGQSLTRFGSSIGHVSLVCIFLGGCYPSSAPESLTASLSKNPSVPSISTGGLTQIPEAADTSGLNAGLPRPTSSCGNAGSIADRIVDCRTKNSAVALVEKITSSRKVSWSLVSRTVEGSEVWRDNETHLVWSDRIGWSSRQVFNWCHASGSNNKSGSPYAENDPFFWCSGEKFQDQLAPVSACVEDSVNLNGILQSDQAKGGLGKLQGATTPFLWRLPSIGEVGKAFSNGAAKVLPRVAETQDPPIGGLHQRTFWTSTIFAANRRMAIVFDFRLGKADINFRSPDSHSVVCVGEESSQIP